VRHAYIKLSSSRSRSVAYYKARVFFSFSLSSLSLRPYLYRRNDITIYKVVCSQFPFGLRTLISNVCTYIHEYYIVTAIIHYCTIICAVSYVGIYCCYRIDQAPARRSQPTVAVRATPNNYTQSPDETASPSSRDTVRGLRTLSLARRQSTCCERDDYLIRHTRA